MNPKGSENTRKNLDLEFHKKNQGKLATLQLEIEKNTNPLDKYNIGIIKQKYILQLEFSQKCCICYKRKYKK